MVYAMSSQAPALPRPSALRQPLRLLASLLSLRYFALRAATAGAAVAFGLVQTFVFARVLGAQEFSLYILIGTFGISLWLFDLGAAKILFVRQRERHLSGHRGGTVPGHGRLPQLDTIAAAGPTQGALLLFKIQTVSLDNRPLTFHVVDPTDAAQTASAELDV